MADNVQWFKIKVGMFDGNSFKKIKRAKIGGISYRDKLTAIWFELLDLAAKGNQNGYLVDGNEIPFHTFEEIAIMLDREDKEVELCIQFFVAEKMIEIIDDMYCLSNFIKYQSIEGLEKIREQKRTAQAKWRERVKLGLIGTDVETTSNLQDNLPSVSISKSIFKSNNKIEEYFNTLWKLYPKKEARQQAINTFEHKFRGLTEQEAKDKANQIYLHLNQFISKWDDENTEYKYIPHFSSWLNAEIPNSAHYKGNNRGMK